MKVESFFNDGFSWSKIADEPKCGMDKLVESLREEKCCSICESSEDGCGANDLSEAEYWEMKADIYNGL